MNSQIVIECRKIPLLLYRARDFHYSIKMSIWPVACWHLCFVQCFFWRSSANSEASLRIHFTNERLYVMKNFCETTIFFVTKRQKRDISTFALRWQCASCNTIQYNGYHQRKNIFHNCISVERIVWPLHCTYFRKTGTLMWCVLNEYSAKFKIQENHYKFHSEKLFAVALCSWNSFFLLSLQRMAKGWARSLLSAVE